MVRETYTDKAVKDLFDKSCFPVSGEKCTSGGKDLSDSYNVFSSPCLFVTDSKGEELDRWYGHKVPSVLVGDLKAVLEGKSFAALKRRAADDPSDTKTAVELARKYYERATPVSGEAYDEAEKLCRIVIKTESSPATLQEAERLLAIIVYRKSEGKTASLLEAYFVKYSDQINAVDEAWTLLYHYARLQEDNGKLSKIADYLVRNIRAGRPWEATRLSDFALDFVKKGGSLKLAALDLAKKAAELEPRDAAILDALTVVYSSNGFHKEAAETQHKALDAKDAAVRLDAIEAIATIDRLIDPDQRGRTGFPPDERLVDLLKRLGPAEAQIVPALTNALKDEDSRVRGAAAKLLGDLGREAALAGPAILDLMNDKDRSVRRVAIHAAANLALDRKSLLAALTRAAKDADPRVRESAIVVLARTLARDKDGDQPEVKPALDAVGEGLKDTSEDVRITSAHVLWDLGAKAESLVPALKAALGDTSEAVRVYAAGTLLRISPGNEAATNLLAKEIPALTDLLHASGSGEVIFASRVLAMLGVKAEPAVPALLDVLEMPRQDAEPGGAAREAILRIGKAAAPALRREAGSKDVRRRILAAALLGKIAPDDKLVISVLSESLKDEDANIRFAAARELGELGTAAREAVPTLKEALKDKEQTVRKSAAQALEKVRGKE